MNKNFLKSAISQGDSHALSFAPGRIEFLGNHLDYNGGTVLGMAIDAGIYCLGVSTGEDSFTLESEGFPDAEVKGLLENIEKQKGKLAWANYPLGVLLELQRKDLAPKEGFRLFFASDLPTSVGLSSSAALELATALTLLNLAEKKVDSRELVSLCRAAENNFVGMPCGVLDQGTSAHGKKNNLVRIDCRMESYQNLALPEDTQAWIFDTGIKHDLVDSLYSVRHQECQDALAKIRERFPATESLTSTDLTKIENADLNENLRKRAIHVSEEQARVESFCRGIELNTSPQDLGKLLQQSHQSSSKNFENSCPELDYLADTLNQHPLILGARLTGGGFGGAVMAWTSPGFNESNASEITRLYEEQFNREAKWYRFQPSEGARPLDLQEI